MIDLSYRRRYVVLMKYVNIQLSTQRRDVHWITKDLDLSAFTSATRILIKKGPSSLRTVPRPRPRLMTPLAVAPTSDSLTCRSSATTPSPD